jgi:hypothetical protein
MSAPNDPKSTVSHLDMCSVGNGSIFGTGFIGLRGNGLTTSKIDEFLSKLPN